MNLTHHISRATDPASSHAAGEEVTRSGRREGQCLAVLALVRKYPGRTSMELAGLSLGLDRYAVARRLPELEKDGLVRRGEIRECSIGKRAGTTWYVDRHPEQLRLGM